MDSISIELSYSSVDTYLGRHDMSLNYWLQAALLKVRASRGESHRHNFE